MIARNQNIVIDIDTEVSGSIYTLRQWESSTRELYLTFTSNGTPFDSSPYTVYVQIIKPNGKQVYWTLAQEHEKVIFPIRNTITNLIGNVQCTITFVDTSENEVAVTPPFYFEVKRSLADGLQDEPMYDYFLQAIQQLNDAMQQVEDLFESANGFDERLLELESKIASHETRISNLESVADWETIAIFEQRLIEVEQAVEALSSNISIEDVDGNTVFTGTTPEAIQWVYSKIPEATTGDDVRIQAVEDRLNNFKLLDSGGQPVITGTLEVVSQWLYNYAVEEIHQLDENIAAVEKLTTPVVISDINKNPSFWDIEVGHYVPVYMGPLVITPVAAVGICVRPSANEYYIIAAYATAGIVKCIWNSTTVGWNTETLKPISNQIVSGNESVPTSNITYELDQRVTSLENS